MKNNNLKGLCVLTGIVVLVVQWAVVLEKNVDDYVANWNLKINSVGRRHNNADNTKVHNESVCSDSIECSG